MSEATLRFPVQACPSSVVLNFMCQLDWAIGAPESWPNIIPGVDVRVLSDEINI